MVGWCLGYSVGILRKTTIIICHYNRGLWGGSNWALPEYATNICNCVCFACYVQCVWEECCRKLSLCDIAFSCRKGWENHKCTTVLVTLMSLKRAHSHENGFLSLGNVCSSRLYYFISVWLWSTDFSHPISLSVPRRRRPPFWSSFLWGLSLNITPPTAKYILTLGAKEEKWGNPRVNHFYPPLSSQRYLQRI